MIRSEFKKLGISTSLLGFGCMRLPTIGGDETKIDQAAAEAMVDYAYAQGLNYFDTAYPYHGGTSETFMGRALKKYPRESFYLADKMPLWDLSTADELESIFNEQLQKCQVEYFDFYLLHSMDREKLEKVKKINAVEFLRQKRAEGKIRNIGFSFHDDAACLKDILKLFDWDFVQIQLNYADWSMLDAKELYQILASQDIPCIVMEPVRGGFLANLPEKISGILNESGSQRTQAAWALGWVASLPNVKVILSGMSNMDQLKENIQLFSSESVRLSEEEKFYVHKAVSALQEIKTVPCTGCRYCMECNFGVDIPTIFKLYNSYKLFGNTYAFKDGYRKLGNMHQGHNCQACGACRSVCPQQISIPDWLETIQQEFEKLTKKD